MSTLRYFAMITLWVCFFCLPHSITSDPVASIHVVLSRYEEDVAHLSYLEHIPHTIYNRGNISNIRSMPFKLHVVELIDNVGRESHVFLRYIIENYHHLSDITIFSQASDSPHTRAAYSNAQLQQDILDFYSGKNYLRDVNDGFAFCVPMCLYVHPGCEYCNYEAYFKKHKIPLYIPPNAPANATRNGKLVRERRSSNDNVNINSTNNGSSSSLYAGPKNVIVDHPVPVLVKEPRFGPTGCFFVTREAIHRNPVQQYINLARTIGKDNNPLDGHFFERFWPQIFQSTCGAHEEFYCFLEKYDNIPCDRS